jgi:hypothetical protein
VEQFEFSSLHELHGACYQKLRSKLACVMHVGAPPPREPVALKIGKKTSDSWEEKRERFSAFLVANFVPWECGEEEAECCPPELTEEALVGWQKHLHTLAESPDPSPDRCIARGRLFAMRQHTNALSIDSRQKQAHTQWRSRNRTEWPPEEKKEDVGKPSDGKTDSAADIAIAQFQEGQRSSVIDPERLTRHAAQERFMDGMLSGLGLQLPPSEDSGMHRSTARQPAMRGEDCGMSHVSTKEVDINFKGMRTIVDEKVTSAGAPGAGPQGGAVPNLSTSWQAQPMPVEFEFVNKEEYQDQVTQWEGKVVQAKEAGQLPPPPPLGNEQRDITRAIYPKLTEIARVRGQMPNATRQQYMQVIEDGNPGNENDYLFLLHGAAGTGKTEVIKALERVLKNQNLGTLLLTAFTGSAVVSLENAVTLLHLNGWGIDLPYRQTDIADVPTADEINTFKRYADTDTLRILVIDEVSFINPTVLQHFNKRLQVLLNCKRPFGGLIVILAGGTFSAHMPPAPKVHSDTAPCLCVLRSDFHQKPTTNPPALHAALVAKHTLPFNDEGELVKQRTKTKVKKSALPTELTAEAKGVDVFEKFTRKNLTISHRFRDDPRYGELLNGLRDFNNIKPLDCDELLEALKPLSTEEAKDPKFMFATVGVVSNLERHTINAARAFAFAKHHGLVLIRWRLNLVGLDSQRLDAKLIDELYDEEVGLWGYFVKGAPGIIEDNLAQLKGIVNGTSCTMHSLTLQSDATDDLDAMVRRAGPGGVVTLSMPPHSINVEPNVIEKFAELLRPNSLDSNKVVIPIKLCKGQEVYNPTSVFAAYNGLPCAT